MIKDKYWLIVLSAIIAVKIGLRRIYKAKKDNYNYKNIQEIKGLIAKTDRFKGLEIKSKKDLLQ